MKTKFVAWLAIVMVVGLHSNVFAQAFPNDNDGLLDVGEAPGFPTDPAATTGRLSLHSQNIQDLGGTSLLVNLRELQLPGNVLTSIERGDFDGLATLQSLALGWNDITSITPGAFKGLDNVQRLSLRGNDITNIAPGAFDGLANLQRLRLDTNHIAKVEEGVFEGLANLQELDLRYNAITTIEPGAFAGLFNLETLLFTSDIIPSELNLTAATFNHLQPAEVACVCPPSGFWVDGGSGAISSLVLNVAQLSHSSFDAIVGQTPFLVDASLVGLTFTDETPSDLSNLLTMPTLENVTVDPSLFGLYETEFNVFAAMPGKTVTIVPEPSGNAFLLILAIGAAMHGRCRIRRCESGNIRRAQFGR